MFWLGVSKKRITFARNNKRNDKMKKLLFLIIMGFAFGTSAFAQNYVIDVLYGADSVACSPVIPKGKKFKNAEEEMTAKRKKYLHDGETVKVTAAPTDSLRLRDFMTYKDVEITIAGKKYTTAARNIILADTTGTVADAVNGMLKNKPCLFELDMHGKHRYLFNYRIIVAMLAIGLFGAFLTIKTGPIGYIFLIVPLLYFTWLTLHCGWDAYWFINPKAYTSKFKIYLIFILAAAFAVFAVKAVWVLFDDSGGTEHLLGLIAAPFLLPILYITVWGGLLTQWALLLVAFFGYGYVVSILDGSLFAPSVKTLSWGEERRIKREEKAYRDSLRRQQKEKDDFARWMKFGGPK